MAGAYRMVGAAGSSSPLDFMAAATAIMAATTTAAAPTITGAATITAGAGMAGAGTEGGTTGTTAVFTAGDRPRAQSLTLRPKTPRKPGRSPILSVRCV